MRQVSGRLSKELWQHTKPENVGIDNAYPVKTFKDLVQNVAKLAYVNKDYILFYRGQKNDYKNKAGSSTFYPSIYRGDYLTKQELNYRFDLLKSASKILVYEFTNQKFYGYHELSRKKYIQWSVLQHYEVTGTPLSDITQSLRVACSFAQLKNNQKTAFIYVFALPYFTNRISINSEDDLVNIRLLSITPPDALRPYFQEGYLVGTEDITNEYENKSELDLNRRLIAKFQIPNNDDFWTEGFDKIPENALYPTNDRIQEICDKIKDNLSADLEIGGLGLFLKLWNEMENSIFEKAQLYQQNILNFKEALFVLKESEDEISLIIDKVYLLKKFRNKLIKNPVSISKKELIKNTITLQELNKMYS